MRSRERVRRAASAARGGVLVELVMALPILLIFMFGIVDYGRAFSMLHRAASLSRGP